jgi:hypothetical protein
MDSGMEEKEKPEGERWWLLGGRLGTRFQFAHLDWGLGSWSSWRKKHFQAGQTHATTTNQTFVSLADNSN